MSYQPPPNGQPNSELSSSRRSLAFFNSLIVGNAHTCKSPNITHITYKPKMYEREWEWELGAKAFLGSPGAPWSLEPFFYLVYVSWYGDWALS